MKLPDLIENYLAINVVIKALKAENKLIFK